MSQADIHASLTRTVAPTLEPMTLQEAKDHLKVDTTDEDSLIEPLITAVRQHVEGRDGWLGRALLTQTWEWRLDRFPTGRSWKDALRVPLPPLQSVTSIQYVDTAGATQTWSPSLYNVSTYSQPGRIAPAFGQVFPSTQTVIDAVTVTFVAGYGANPEDIPGPILAALKLMIGDLYCNRDTRLRQGTIDNPTVARLLMPHRIWGFG